MFITVTVIFLFKSLFVTRPVFLDFFIKVDHLFDYFLHHHFYWFLHYFFNSYWHFNLLNFLHKNWGSWSSIKLFDMLDCLNKLFCQVLSIVWNFQYLAKLLD